MVKEGEPRREAITSSSSSPSLCDSETEDLERMPLVPLPLMKNNRRRRQILRQERRKNGIIENGLTDEDLHELKGCIELGFGFNEEEGQKLTSTLPALDLYFAVNRQLSPSPVSTPHSRGSSLSLGDRSSSFGSPTSTESDWKIYSPGEDPQLVKTKLRHWAQAVACSVLQSF
ncbi:hypothetical protein Goarm_017301 [Gossypium armourianum]|uniref:Uncharacterized protein n=1 Tax=Gossypium armourianum TaxID=34283 RepID=A0A7J9JEW7_9ROSI|nr:hypothetical protein [Gossypium armourianum]